MVLGVCGVAGVQGWPCRWPTVGNSGAGGWPVPLTTSAQATAGGGVAHLGPELGRDFTIAAATAGTPSAKCPLPTVSPLPRPHGTAAPGLTNVTQHTGCEDDQGTPRGPLEWGRAAAMWSWVKWWLCIQPLSTLFSLPPMPMAAAAFSHPGELEPGRGPTSCLGQLCLESTKYGSSLI